MQKLFENWRDFKKELLNETPRPMGHTVQKAIINHIIKDLKTRVSTEPGWYQRSRKLVYTVEEIAGSNRNLQDAFKKFPLLDQVEFKINAVDPRFYLTPYEKDPMKLAKGSASGAGVTTRYNPGRGGWLSRPRTNTGPGTLKIVVDINEWKGGVSKSMSPEYQARSAKISLGKEYFKRLREVLKGIYEGSWDYGPQQRKGGSRGMTSRAAPPQNVIVHELEHFSQGRKGEARPGPGRSPHVKAELDVRTKGIKYTILPGGKVVYETLPDELKSNFRGIESTARKLRRPFVELYARHIDNFLKDFPDIADSPKVEGQIRHIAWTEAKKYAKSQFPLLHEELKKIASQHPEVIAQAPETMKQGKLGKLTARGQAFFSAAPDTEIGAWAELPESRGMSASRVTGGAAIGALLALDLYLRISGAPSLKPPALTVLEFVRDNALWTAIGIAGSVTTGSVASTLLPGIFISFILSGMEQAATEEFIRYSARQDREDYPGDHEPKPSEITPPDPTEIGPVPDEDKAIKESRKSISKLNVLIG